MFYQDIDRYEAEQEEPEAYNDDVETYRDDGTSYYSRATPSRTDDEKTQIELYKYFLSRGMRQQQALASTRQVMSSMGVGHSKQAEFSLGDTGARLLSGAIGGGLGATSLGYGGSTQKKLIGGGLGALAGLMLNEKERTPAGLGATIGGSLYSGGGLRRAATGALLGGTAGAVFPHSPVGAGAIAGAGAGLMHVSATAPMSKFLDRSKLYSLQDRLSNALRKSPLEAKSNQRSALVGGPNAVFNDVQDAVQQINAGLADNAARRMSGASISDAATMKPSWWQRYMPDWMGGLGSGVDLSSGQPGRNLANLDQDEVGILERARDVLQGVNPTTDLDSQALSAYAPDNLPPVTRFQSTVQDVAGDARRLADDVRAFNPLGSTATENFGSKSRSIMQEAEDLARQYSSDLADIREKANPGIAEATRKAQELRDQANLLDQVRDAKGALDADLVTRRLEESLDKYRDIANNKLTKENLEDMLSPGKPTILNFDYTRPLESMSGDEIRKMILDNNPGPLYGQRLKNPEFDDLLNVLTTPVQANKIQSLLDQKDAAARRVANLVGQTVGGISPLDFTALRGAAGSSVTDPGLVSRINDILSGTVDPEEGLVSSAVKDYLSSLKPKELRDAAKRITGPGGQLDELNRLQQAAEAALNRRGNVSLRKLQEQAGLLPELAQRTYDGYLQQAQALRNYRSGFADEAINAAINADNAQAHLMTPLALAGIGAGGGLVLGDRLGMNKESSFGSVMDSARSAVGSGLASAPGMSAQGVKSMFSAAGNVLDSVFANVGYASTPSLPQYSETERALFGTNKMESLRQHINENYPLYLTAAAAALPVAAYFMHNPGMEDMRTRGRI